MTRPPVDEYFLRIAYVIAQRSTCDRKHVGSLIVDDYKRIVSTGYNGSPAGLPHCGSDNHEMHDNHCIRTLHAESNAIDYAGREARNCTIYCTVTPCIDCAKRIVNAGIKRAVWNEHYESRYGASGTVRDFLTAAHVQTFVASASSFSESMVAWMKIVELDPINLLASYTVSKVI